MHSCVTVAIPTLNAGAAFARTLAAVRAQQLALDVQLLICDSGSSDETLEIASTYGAEIVRIPRQSFSHGGTRNLLMSRSRGDQVAFLTQDAVPATTDWLSELVGAFALAANVGLAFGPYVPDIGASNSVARELTAWFESFSSGGPRIDSLAAAQRGAPPRAFLGHLGFFTDANGCVSRDAWQQVPFRPIRYAEDHLLAQDMLRAGFAKVYVPTAAVIHSHDYPLEDWLRRSFDEARAVHEVYGWTPSPRQAAWTWRGNVMADWRSARRAAAVNGARRLELSILAASALHHGARTVGGLLGGHAARLPGALAARLSLEGRP